MKPLHTTSEGFTIVEALVWLVVGGMMIAATSLFLGRGITVSREQFQQVLTTEDARIQLERLPFVLRNARNDIAEGWLVDSHQYSITVLTNVDADPDIERIRYFLEDTELKRGETQPGEEEQVEIIARSLHNIGAGVPLLRYYDSNGEEKDPAGTEVTSENIARLEITLIVDPDPTQEPGETVISSIIIPRGSVAFAREEGTARLFPVTLDLPALAAGIDTAEVTVTDLTTGSNSSDVVYVASLNDGRVKTYTKNHYVNINYQPLLNASDGTLPGWYAWVGPMLAGMSGGQSYYVTDKIPLSSVCQGSDLAVMNSDDTVCPKRTVTDGSGSFSVTYKPIFTYTGDDGFEDYIRNITYNHTGGTVSTLQNGLAGYWDFEEGGGTWVFDSTSNRNDAGFRNMETDDWAIDTAPTAFINRYALSFDGVDEYLQAADSSSLDLTSAITIAAWVDIGAQKDQGIVSKGDSSNAAYSLILHPNSNLSFRLNSNSSVINSSSSVGLDGWHHVAATYNQSTGEQKLYIDGTEAASTSYTVPIAPNNLPLYIGRYHNINNLRTFNGTLDEVRIYDRALTASEISELADGEN